MKSARKPSLRREALAELAGDELGRVAGGVPTLDGLTCWISTITVCGYICNIEIENS